MIPLTSEQYNPKITSDKLFNINEEMKNSIPISSLLLLFMIICGNFLSPLFPCEIQKMLRTNMAVKYIAGFFTLFLFIELSNVSDTETNIFSTLVRSVILYVWFILMTLMNHKIMFGLVALFGILYIIKQYISELEKKANPESIQRVRTLEYVENIVYYSCIALTLVGVIIYYSDNKQKLNNLSDIKRIFTRSVICKPAKN